MLHLLLPLGLQASQLILLGPLRKKSLQVLASEVEVDLEEELRVAQLDLLEDQVQALQQGSGLHQVVVDLVLGKVLQVQETADLDLAITSHQPRMRLQVAALDQSRQASLAGVPTRIRSGEHL